MTDEIIELTRVPDGYDGRGSGGHLPSTELRQAAPEWDAEEVHLRDYLDVIFRRKWLIVSFLMLTFISTLILTLASSKIYKAFSSIEISSENQKVTKFEEVLGTEMRAQEFYQTQVDLLQNSALAWRVIEKLDLAENPVVLETLYGGENPNLVLRLKKWVQRLINDFTADSEEAKNNAPEVSEEALKQRDLIQFIEDNLEVSPKRNSMLISISFASPDRHLSQNVVNGFVEEFVRWNMDKKLEASRLARDFLMKQIDRAKINPVSYTHLTLPTITE